MDNPNVMYDEDESVPLDQADAETIRLRPYYDWTADTTVSITSDFPRVSSQVPLSPKTFDNNEEGHDTEGAAEEEDEEEMGDDCFGYGLTIQRDEEDDDTFGDDDSDEKDSDERKRHKPLKRLPSIARSTSRTRKRKGSKNFKERGTWEGRFDFILSLIGYSVGLGNVWRFPYLVYNNGGGAFLIPFLVMMSIVGFPLMFMELSFGQYASKSPVVIFSRFCPLFSGLGYGMVAVSGIVMLYYNMILAWTLFYMIISFRSELPWSRCDPEWSTKDCFSYKEKDECLALHPNGTYFNRTCYDAINSVVLNITTLAAQVLEKKAPADEYFHNQVLGNINTIERTGNIQWHLLVCLLIAWIGVFLCLCHGVQSSGKVVYFTALFPYVVLVILFVRGITLPGAWEGISFYLKPDFSHLFVAQVWGDAAVQVFFALSPAWGGLITLASYNKFNNNCFRDSILVLFANAGTSIFSGFVVFSIIGYLAHELELPVGQVVDQGVGLAFMVYPEVVTRLPAAPLWSFLFFLMLITLGLDSQFALLETVQTAILDRFPTLRDHKILILILVSTIGYAGGIIFTTQSGILWLELFDRYSANFSVSIIAITECLLINWYYGTERFIRDIEKMIGPRSEEWHKLWTWMWRYITPSTLIFILVFNWIKHEPARSGDYVYPEWANIFGWILAFIPTFIIIFTMIRTYITYSGGKNKTILQKINALMQPTEHWGPTSRNLERLQRRSITSSSHTNSRGNSVKIKDPKEESTPQLQHQPPSCHTNQNSQNGRDSKSTSKKFEHSTQNGPNFDKQRLKKEISNGTTTIGSGSGGESGESIGLTPNGTVRTKVTVIDLEKSADTNRSHEQGGSLNRSKKSYGSSKVQPMISLTSSSNVSTDSSNSSELTTVTPPPSNRQLSHGKKSPPHLMIEIDPSISSFASQKVKISSQEVHPCKRQLVHPTLSNNLSKIPKARLSPLSTASSLPPPSDLFDNSSFSNNNSKNSKSGSDGDVTFFMPKFAKQSTELSPRAQQQQPPQHNDSVDRETSM